MCTRTQRMPAGILRLSVEARQRLLILDDLIFMQLHPNIVEAGLVVALALIPLRLRTILTSL